MLYYIPLWRAPPLGVPLFESQGEGGGGAIFAAGSREREGQEKKPPMGKKKFYKVARRTNQKRKPRRAFLSPPPPSFFLNGQTVLLRTIYTVQGYSADFGGRWIGIRRFFPGFPDRKQVFSRQKYFQIPISLIIIFLSLKT